MGADYMSGDGDTNIILVCASISFGEMLQQYKDNWDKKVVSVVIFENTLTVKI